MHPFPQLLSRMLLEWILEGVMTPVSPAGCRCRQPTDAFSQLTEIVSLLSGRQMVGDELFADASSIPIDPDIRCGLSW